MRTGAKTLREASEGLEGVEVISGERERESV